MKTSALFLAVVFFGFSAKAQDSLQSRQLDEVVVTGQYEPQSLKKSVYQVRTIPNSFIRLRNATNVQSLLTTELGIRFSVDPTLGTSDITLMGMSGQNVKILMDGVPMIDRGATRESLNQIDVNTIERIEIVEGPMSVLYGSDALAGVINIITRKAAGSNDDEKLSVEAKVQEETVAKEYSPLSGDGSHLENVGVNWSKSAWNAGLGATRNDYGGWQGSSGGRSKQWHAKNQWLGNGSVGFKKEDFSIWYRLNYLNETITALGSINPNNIAGDKEYITNRYTHQVQSEWTLNERWSLTTMLSYQDYTRRTLSTNLNVVTGDRRLSLEAGSQDKSSFGSEVFRGISVYKFSSRASLQSGVDINLNQGSGDRIDGARTINDYAIFFSSELSPTDRISIRPGLRFFHNSVYDAPPVIPSINTKFSLGSKADGRLAYARGFRSPALRELYFYFFDASHSIKGNTDLKAEFSHSLTGSLSWHVRQSKNFALTTKAGGFFNQFENLITLGVDPVNPAQYTYINIYKNRTAGGTFDNMFTWKNVKGTLGFSYIGIFNQFSEEDTTLPPMMWIPEVNSTLTYSFKKAGIEVITFYKFTGARSSYQIVSVADGTQSIQLGRINSYQWADLTVSKTINKSINLNIGAKNIFNVTQLQNSIVTTGGAHGTGGSIPLGYGRSYFVGITAKWNKK